MEARRRGRATRAPSRERTHPPARPRARAPQDPHARWLESTRGDRRPAPDLPREAFQLFEEGIEQKIDKFESETSQPLDLAIMIDSSLSAHKEISFEQEAAAHFIRKVLRPGDRLSVFAFDESVTQLAAFSDNVPE